MADRGGEGCLLWAKIERGDVKVGEGKKNRGIAGARGGVEGDI